MGSKRQVLAAQISPGRSPSGQRWSPSVKRWIPNGGRLESKSPRMESKRQKMESKSEKMESKRRKMESKFQKMESKRRTLAVQISQDGAQATDAWRTCQAVSGPTPPAWKLLKRSK